MTAAGAPPLKILADTCSVTSILCYLWSRDWYVVTGREFRRVNNSVFLVKSLLRRANASVWVLSAEALYNFKQIFACDEQFQLDNFDAS